MAWTTPKTDWATGELVTAEDMNAVGENLAVLKNQSTASYTTTTDITENTGGEFRDVDGTNLNLTITTAGGDVLVHFYGRIQRGESHATWIAFDIDIDGIQHGGDDGVIRNHISGGYLNENFTRLITNLSAGSHTFKLQWKNSRSIRLNAGAHFWVREL